MKKPLNTIVLTKTIELSPCAYCDTQFAPTPRRGQIYCSGSCRTQACRERKNGLSGVLQDKPKATSITDLLHLQVEINRGLKDEIYALRCEMLAISNEIKVANTCMLEIYRTTNDIKQSLGNGLVRDIARTLEDWNYKGMSKAPEQLKAMKLDISKIVLLNEKILKDQSDHMWLTGLSSLAGPIVGEKIFTVVKETFTGKKDIPMGAKLDILTDAVTKLNKVV